MYKTLAATALTLAFALPTLAHPGHDTPSAASPTDHKQPRQRESPGKDKEPHAPVSAYKADEILGWGLLVHEDLIADKDLWQQVRDEIHHQLFRITRVVPEEKVELLKQVPIWVELDNPYTNNCQFHPSAKWLKENGYLVEKAKTVDLGNARRFLHTTKTTQPFVLLHELAHAYHDIHLGFEHKGIVDAYKDAMKQGQYESVLHINGRMVKHYSTTDHKEYFAEATEAYFGTNDHYPFVRSELKAHDPTLYALLEEVWGVKR